MNDKHKKSAKGGSERNAGERVRNLKPFIRGYAGTDHGKRTLKRSTFRDKQGKVQWRNPALAEALVKAAE